MIRRLMLTTAVLALAACGAPDPEPAPPEAPAGPSAPAAPVDANALTAQGFGPLRIGMSKAEVEAAMGPDSNPGRSAAPSPMCATSGGPSARPTVCWS